MPLFVCSRTRMRARGAPLSLPHCLLTLSLLSLCSLDVYCLSPSISLSLYSLSLSLSTLLSRARPRRRVSVYVCVCDCLCVFV